MITVDCYSDIQLLRIATYQPAMWALRTHIYSVGSLYNLNFNPAHDTTKNTFSRLCWGRGAEGGGVGEGEEGTEGGAGVDEGGGGGGHDSSEPATMCT
jgi:hypothetical protein